jgi:hypothetical protein
MKEKVMFDFIKYCLISNQIECNKTEIRKQKQKQNKTKNKKEAEGIHELTFITIKEGHSMSTFLNI